jgi:hypothetical protein
MGMDHKRNDTDREDRSTEKETLSWSQGVHPKFHMDSKSATTY